MPTPINNRKTLLGFQKSYAFLIGINNYPRINAHLQSAVNDAKALAQVLKHQQGFDHVELLVETTPDIDETREAEKQAKLKDGLDGIVVQFSASGATFRNLLARIQDPEQAPKINPHDCIVFYYAGHGKPGEFDDGPAGYLLPSDTRPDVAKLKNDSLLPMEAVFEALKVLDCHHTLLILDCCFAGKFRQASKSRETGWITNLPLYEERFMRYKRERAWQVLVSAGPHQTAADWLGERQELNENDHSPFAQALLDALAGKAELSAAGKKLGDGVLTSQELFLYLWDKVERLTNTGKLGKNSQYPDLFPMSNHQGGQFIFFDPNNKLNFAERTLRNPYQGLKPFETSESDLFFGRQAIVKTLLPRLLTQPLLVITAPSGSGKSSLAKAGLFPALTNWQNEAGETPWVKAELLVLRPGAKPWSGEPQYPKDGTDQNNIIYTGLRALLPRLQKDKKQVLLIDQYEELFTDGATEEERTFFENELRDRYRQAHERQLKIIITLRSDYEWLLEESTFGKVFWQQDQLTQFLYRLPPMQLNELREALVNPALAELYEFETEKLVENILAEIGHAPGALSMLSFTMSQFYELTDKDTRVFTSTTYKKLGGVNGALSKYADGIYAALEPDEQDIMKKLLIRMVRFSDGRYGRRRVYVRPAQHTEELQEGASANAIIRPAHQAEFLNEFDYPDHQDALVLKVLELLEDRQLLLVGGDNIGRYYEPVHDMLIQQWKTAKQWMAQFGTENIALQRDLWQAVQDNSQPKKRHNKVQTADFSKLWDNNHKLLQVLVQIASAAKAYFLKEEGLVDKELMPLLPVENRAHFKTLWDEIKTKHETPDLNTVILPGYSDLLLDIFLQKGNHWLNEAEVAFVRQSWAKRIAQVLEVVHQRDEAVKSKALAYSSIAENMPREQKNIALRIAQLAYKTTPAPLPKVSRALGNIFYSQIGIENETRVPVPVKRIALSGVDILNFSYSPSGRQLIVVAKEANASFSIDFKPPPPIHQLWDKQKGVLLANLSTQEDSIKATSFSPKGEYLYTLTAGGILKKWELASGNLLDTLAKPELFSGAALAPDGQHLITLLPQKKPQLWTVAGEKLTELSGFKKADDPKLTNVSQEQVFFSPQGDVFIYAHNSGEVGLYQMDGQYIADLSDEKRAIADVHFPTEANFFYLIRMNGHYSHYRDMYYSVQAYSKSGVGKPYDHFTERKAQAIYFSPDGKYLFAKLKDANANLLRSDGVIVSDEIFYNSDKAVVFSPKSTHLVILSGDVFIDIWSLAEGKVITKLNLPSFGIKSTKAVKSMAFSPDGQLLLIASSNKTAKIWDLFGMLVSDMIMGTDVQFAYFTPNGREVITAAYRSMSVWTAAGALTTEMVVAEHSKESNIEYTAAFSPDGQQILVSLPNMPAEIWSNSGQLSHKIAVEGKSISQVFFIKTGLASSILTLSPSEPAQIWDTHGKCSFTFPEGSQATAGAASPDGHLLATILSGKVSIWQKDQPKAIRLTDTSYIVGVQFINHAENQALITLTDKGAAVRFDLAGKQLTTITEGLFNVYYTKLSTRGLGVLIDGAGSSQFHYLDEREDLILSTGLGGARIRTAVFSADDAYLLLARDQKIALWDMKAGTKRWEKAQEDQVLTVDISSDTKTLLAGCQNGKTYLWSLQGELLGTYNYHNSKICTAVFSPDSQSVLTASSNRLVKSWPVPERIYQWLEKESTIADLTADDRDKYGIQAVDPASG